MGITKLITILSTRNLRGCCFSAVSKCVFELPVTPVLLCDNRLVRVGAGCDITQCNQTCLILLISSISTVYYFTFYMFCALLLTPFLFVEYQINQLLLNILPLIILKFIFLYNINFFDNFLFDSAIA